MSRSSLTSCGASGACVYHSQQEAASAFLAEEVAIQGPLPAEGAGGPSVAVVDIVQSLKKAKVGDHAATIAALEDLLVLLREEGCDTAEVGTTVIGEQHSLVRCCEWWRQGVT